MVKTSLQLLAIGALATTAFATSGEFRFKQRPIGPTQTNGLRPTETAQPRSAAPTQLAAYKAELQEFQKKIREGSQADVIPAAELEALVKSLREGERKERPDSVRGKMNAASSDLDVLKRNINTQVKAFNNTQAYKTVADFEYEKKKEQGERAKGLVKKTKVTKSCKANEAKVQFDSPANMKLESRYRSTVKFTPHPMFRVQYFGKVDASPFATMAVGIPYLVEYNSTTSFSASPNKIMLNRRYGLWSCPTTSTIMQTGSNITVVSSEWRPLAANSTFRVVARAMVSDSTVVYKQKALVPGMISFALTIENFPYMLNQGKLAIGQTIRTKETLSQPPISGLDLDYVYSTYAGVDWNSTVVVAAAGQFTAPPIPSVAPTTVNDQLPVVTVVAEASVNVSTIASISVDDKMPISTPGFAFSDIPTGADNGGSLRRRSGPVVSEFGFQDDEFQSGEVDVLQHMKIDGVVRPAFVQWDPSVAFMGSQVDEDVDYSASIVANVETTPQPSSNAMKIQVSMFFVALVSVLMAL